ncbi:MAG: stage V sporulation protein AD [Oscillospiraceae bacterium]|jgi:stage V sporulation protein AD|nr:stage V sporulation protein AD [Oscillospiraceae bacterium]
MPKRTGKKTILFEKPPSIISSGSVAGKKEGEGPLAPYFDTIMKESRMGQPSWEKAERLMQKNSAQKALEKAGLAFSDIDYIFAGDLLNQCVSSSYAFREYDVSFFGLYGACSTIAESLCLAAVFAESGAAKNCLCATSSHFCSAERQFRFPLEYGGQLTPTSQWTATAAGAFIVSSSGAAPFVRAATVGAIEDLGIKDINNMGAAMAPAAAKTIGNFLADTKTKPSDYDLILSGDLGKVGSDMLLQLLKREGVDISQNHNDCGLILFDESQEVNAGASGAGCSAAVLASYIMPKLKSGELGDILFVATGALMSTLTVQQGESIPCIAHLVRLSHGLL